jgi:DNA processing protein
VAIVGTRRCTQTGVSVARQFGRELAASGVAVVSGLALGIDGAAHEGALGAAAAGPVGVVGSGLDVVYPKRHARLWREVAASGALLSEAPLGAQPEPWRFPARNRILAALSDVVVVVESHAAGGSMHTVRAALDRGILVMAVPGSVRNPAAAGANQLLSEGVPPARDTDDILVALGMVTCGPSEPLAFDPRRPSSRREPEGEAGVILAAIGWEAASLDDILSRTDLSPGRVSVALAELVDGGWITRSAGWYERTESAS